MADSYATTADLAARLGMDEVTAAADAALVNAIAAASRAIDAACGRAPGAFSISASQDRYFTGDEGCVEIDPLVTLTALVSDADGDRVYETTWSATDYDLEPYNAAQAGEPYTKLVATPIGRYAFPCIRKGVKVTGLWGYPTVPAAITEATCLLAGRLYKRPSAPFAIDYSSGDMGSSARLPSVDPDVRFIIAPYRHIWIGAL